MHTLFAPAFNLSILLGILFYYLRAPLKQFVNSRHHTTKEELSLVEAQLRDAKARFQEFSSKLNAMEAETRELRTQAGREAAATKARLIEEATKLSADIVRDSKVAAEGLYFELREQLYGELSQQVLDRAEKLLRDRLTGDDRARIQQEFSRQLETGQ